MVQDNGRARKMFAVRNPQMSGMRCHDGDQSLPRLKRPDRRLETERCHLWYCSESCYILDGGGNNVEGKLSQKVDVAEM